MALYSMLRRASSSVLPLAIRSVGSHRTFHWRISSVLTIGGKQLGDELSPRLLFPFQRFSTATAANASTDDRLIEVLESEIKCAEEDDKNLVEEIPDGFPFKIDNNPGERTVLLEREYEDEIIKVEVDIPTSGTEEDEEDDNEAADKHDNKTEESSIPLVINISKGNGLCLEFGVTAFPDEISIDSLSIKNPEATDDQLAYEGPEFHDLDENLQKAFHKYLEIRGITPSTTNFLLEYMISKDSQEYLGWLKKLKYFVEK